MAAGVPNHQDVEGRCERHLFDQAVDLCGRCGFEFCADCLVYSFGTKKPPFCLPCAVEAAGVRQGAGFGTPALNRREQKELKRRRKAFLAAREATRIVAPVTLDDSWLERLENDGLEPRVL